MPKFCVSVCLYVSSLVHSQPHNYIIFFELTRLFVAAAVAIAASAVVAVAVVFLLLFIRFVSFHFIHSFIYVGLVFISLLDVSVYCMHGRHSDNDDDDNGQ